MCACVCPIPEACDTLLENLKIKVDCVLAQKGKQAPAYGHHIEQPPIEFLRLSLNEDNSSSQAKEHSPDALCSAGFLVNSSQK